jgi:hypothetical protein
MNMHFRNGLPATGKAVTLAAKAQQHDSIKGNAVTTHFAGIGLLRGAQKVVTFFRHRN